MSFAFTIPMGYIRVSNAVEAEGQPVDSNQRLSAGKNIVSSEYFQTMGIQIVRGRSFSNGDNEQSRPVALVNQHLADMLWPGQTRSVGVSGLPGGRVVGRGRGRDAHRRYQFLFEDPQPYFYVPIAQEYLRFVLQIRTSMPPEALAPAIERAIRVLEPNLPLYDVQSMSQALGSGLGFFPVRVGAISARRRSVCSHSCSPLLASTGVISYLTSQRTHEIGVRMAIGATQTDIVRLVLQDGSKLVLFGLAAGLLVTLACSESLGASCSAFPHAIR